MLYLDIFDKQYIDKSFVTGLVLSSEINYLRRVYTFNKDSISSYYKKRNFAVKNTHILSRIIEHFPVYLNYDNYRYLSYSDDKIKYLAKHFKFTSEIEYGIVHPSYFFGNNCEDIIIAGYEHFNVNNFVNNWKNENCINILKHNRNDSKLLLPLGTDDGSKSGINSLMINIPKLTIMYREFIKEQMTNLNNDSVVLNKNHFIIKYVLSNMVEDLIDHMLLNKVINKFYNIEEVVPKFKHRFKIFEPTIQLNKYVDNTLDVITNKRLDFMNILHNIQLIFKIDASELLCLPDIGYTKQVKWALLVSRLDHMKFLYDVAKSKDMNKHYINDWKRLATRILKDNNIKNMFSYEREKEIFEKLYEISNY